MEITAEHNLSEIELCKALTGLAAASGIEEEVIEELQKSACDDKPKVPRDRAMKELYQRMLQEFRSAQRDIERYHEEIAMSRMAKAGGQREPLTPEQLRQLQNAIKDRYEFIAAQLQSEGYRPDPHLLDRWKQLGLVSQDVTPETFSLGVPAELHFIRSAFMMGKLIEAVESGKAFAEVMEMAHYAPLLAPDLHAIAVAEQQTANFITDNGADLATKVGQAAIRERNETIRQMAIDFHKRTLTRTVLDQEKKEALGIPTPPRPVETWQQFASELHHLLSEKDRDWQRVAYTELVTAQKEGEAYRLLEQHGADIYVYKRPMSTACPQCVYLYLEKDQKTPRIFKLGEMLAAGSNIGRKQHPCRGGKVVQGGRPDGKEALKAVAGTVHPFCQCMGPYWAVGVEPFLTEAQRKMIRGRSQRPATPDR